MMDICKFKAKYFDYDENVSKYWPEFAQSGKENITVYNAYLNDLDEKENKKSPAQRSFCKNCGSALWVWDPRWPEQVHPFASAVDTELPTSPEKTHIMLEYKADWVEVRKGLEDKEFKEVQHRMPEIVEALRFFRGNERNITNLIRRLYYSRGNK